MAKIVFTVDGRRPGQHVNLAAFADRLVGPMQRAGHTVRVTAQEPFTKEEWLDRFDDHQSWALPGGVADDEIVAGFELPPVALRRYGDRAINLRWHPLRFTGCMQIQNQALQSVLAKWLMPVIPRPKVTPARGNALFACQVRDDVAVYNLNSARPFAAADFQLALQQAFARYERVFVRPHPQDPDSPWVAHLMDTFANAELVAGGSPYAAMESAERVISVSSSMLAEAPYFGAEALPLVPGMLPDTRNRISLATLTDPAFWAEVLR